MNRYDPPNHPHKTTKKQFFVRFAIKILLSFTRESQKFIISFYTKLIYDDVITEQIINVSLFSYREMYLFECIS